MRGGGRGLSRRSAMFCPPLPKMTPFLGVVGAVGGGPCASFRCSWVNPKS